MMGMVGGHVAYGMGCYALQVWLPNGHQRFLERRWKRKDIVTYR